MWVASGVSSTRTISSSGGYLIGQQDDAGLEDPRADQLEPGVVALVEQQVTGAADAREVRVHPQVQDVEQPVGDQRVRHRTEAVHQDVAVLLFQLATSATRSLLITVVLFQSALSRVVEATYFDMLLILSAYTSSRCGHDVAYTS